MKHPLVEYDQFKTHPLFVIDYSRLKESMTYSMVDIRLDIEAQSVFPVNTCAICIIIHVTIMEFDPLSAIVRNI